MGEAANLVKKVVRGVVYGRGDVRLETCRDSWRRRLQTSSFF